MPEHSFCSVCLSRIARLSDREAWHHYGRRQPGHQPEPVDNQMAQTLREVAQRLGIEQ